MMRTVLWAWMAAGLAAADFKIATWNVEHLRRKNNTGEVKRGNADYSRLRVYANRLDADVVALEEVEGSGAARRLFDPGRYNFHFTARTHPQNVGFAIRKTIRFRAQPDVRALGLADNSVRWGADVMIVDSGNAPRLRLLAVHLKSGCFEQPLNTPGADCPKLQQQLPLVEQWIDARAGEGVPFLVLGDWNRRLREGEPFWEEIDDANPGNADLTNVTEGRTSQCLGGKFPRFIDHIVLDKRAALLLKPDSFFLLLYDPGDPQKFKLSDHCAVRSTLTVP